MPANFGPKLLSYYANLSCIPNLKSLDSTVDKISKGSQNFRNAPLAQTHVKFGPKSYFCQHTPQTEVVYQI